MLMKWILFLVFIVFFACEQKETQQHYSFPPEWAPQESVWLGWSTDTDIQQVHLQMAKALHEGVGLSILSRSDSLGKVALRQLAASGVDTTTIRSYTHYIPNVFIRDAGPRFLMNGDQQLAIADFAWNNYGYPKSFQNYQYSNERGSLDNDLATENEWHIVSSPMVSEGGGIDVSTHMLMAFKEMALQRNPGKTLAQIESEYLRVYGKKTMLWLNRMPLMDKVVEGPKVANYFGYGANGHTDEFVRFANDSTILIGMIEAHEKDLDSVSKIDYHIMNENLSILKKATNVNGKPFNIITLPVPSYKYYLAQEILTPEALATGDGPALFKNFKVGDTIQWLPAMSYLNFFISNDCVLVANYWQEGLPESEHLKDEKTIEVLTQLFPNKTIVPINPMALNRNGGGMHCATQQQPKLTN